MLKANGVTVTAYDGGAGDLRIRRIPPKPVHLVITDIRMPDGTTTKSFEACGILNQKIPSC